MFSKKRAIAAMAFTAGAALVLAGCAGGGGNAAEPAATFDPDEEVTLDLAFWGNDVRADLYNQAIEAFNEEYPNITVNSTFLAFPEFWEKRQTEAAGENLPDVMQFDYSYLRQYSQNNLLLDLEPYLGNIIDTEPLPENILDIGVVDDKTTGIPTSTNAWGLFTNPMLLETGRCRAVRGRQLGGLHRVDGRGHRGRRRRVLGRQRLHRPHPELRAAAARRGQEPVQRGRRAAASTRSASPSSGSPVRTIREGIGIPQQRVEEVAPKGAFDTALTASELTWDNFGAGYLGDLGADYTELGLIEPPVTEEGAKDLYLKPSMLHSISANTEHPEAAATLVNFLVNSPAVR